MPRLTHRLKKEFFRIIVEKDDYKCFYCNEGFSDVHPAEYDHLNNNSNDSRIENCVFCHHECNIKKKTSSDWQIKAMEKLKQNERVLLASERRLADTGSVEELTSSQAISKAVRPVAMQWLEEHILMEQELLLRHVVPAIANLCQTQIGWGSHAAIRRYIEEWCNPYNGKFTLTKNDSEQTIIRKRTEN